MIRRLRRADPWLALSAFALLVLGIVIVLSTTLDTPREPLLTRHLVSVAVTLVFCFASAAISYRVFDSLAYVLYALALLGLVIVLVAGVVGSGAQRWLVVGPLRLQPSEFAKIGAIFALARYLSGARVDLSRSSTLARAVALVAAPMVLTLQQPDLGTALSFVGLLGAMVFWAGMPLRRLGAIAVMVASGLLTFRLPPLGGGATVAGTLAEPFDIGLVIGAWVLLGIATAAFMRWRGLGVVSIAAVLSAVVVVGALAPLSWQGIEDYQRERVLSFVDPGHDPSGAGYQVRQSETAIGSGGIGGKGFRHGSQKALAYLPEHHTDFVFSVVGEEFGFVGTTTVLGLFVLLLLRGVRIARLARDPFAGLVAAGAVGLLAYHVFVNLAMTMGLAPVTGLPLPFLSYGGSFLIVCGALVGLLEGVSMRRLY